MILAVEQPPEFATHLVQLTFKFLNFAEEGSQFEAALLEKQLGLVILFQNDFFELLFTGSLTLEELQVAHPLLVFV